jgi:DNA polymerase III delta prime subunit
LNPCFESFLGNRELTDHLSAAISAGRYPHAAMFVGDDGCGRHTIARMTAAAYLGTEYDQVRRGACPDCIEVSGSGASGAITVDSVRKAVSESHLSSVGTDGKRAFIIIDAQNLNGSSASALLKTLEEPVDGVVFILTARARTDVKDTIASRCQVFTLSPLDAGECCQEAEKRTGCSSEAAMEFSRFFGGRLGMVLAFLRDKELAAMYAAARRCAEAAEKGSLYGMLLESSAYTSRSQAAAFWELVSESLAYDGMPQMHMALERERRAVTASNANIKLFSTRISLMLASKR